MSQEQAGEGRDCPNHSVAEMQQRLKVDKNSQHPPRFLILYGSLREQSYSRFLAHVAEDLLKSWGAEVEVFHSHDLPFFDRENYDHPEVKKLRELVNWCEGMVWSCP